MQRFRVLYTGDYLNEAGQPLPGIGLDLLDGVPHIEVGFLTDQSPKESDTTYWDRLYSIEITPEHVAAANGLVVCRPWVKASAFMKGAENLLAIGRAGAGYDKIDVSACTRHDVLVFNCPDTLTHSTASAALLLLLALAKRLPQQERLARSGRWDRQADVMGDDLTGQTLGIIGLGNTGLELARLIAPFGMNVIAFSPRAEPSRAQSLGIRLTATLDELLQNSDFVSLHCRLEEKNRGMIGEGELKLMKPTSYLINVARGELIKQEILVRCLRERWIAGAGLDVFETEPITADDPLLSLDNVILTPHWLPSTYQAARATLSSIADGMIRIATGELPRNILNPEVLKKPSFQAKLIRLAVASNGKPGQLWEA
ncbi:MAG: hypothetical protein JOZ45_13165 [Acidobacteriaceae bacterium]|nr:hypothetical protein [Acidobacteriaceae bacterium]